MLKPLLTLALLIWLTPWLLQYHLVTAEAARSNGKAVANNPREALDQGQASALETTGSATPPGCDEGFRCYTATYRYSTFISIQSGNVRTCTKFAIIAECAKQCEEERTLSAKVFCEMVTKKINGHKHTCVQSRRSDHAQVKGTHEAITSTLDSGSCFGTCRCHLDFSIKRIRMPAGKDHENHIFELDPNIEWSRTQGTIFRMARCSTEDMRNQYVAPVLVYSQYNWQLAETRINDWNFTCKPQKTRNKRKCNEGSSSSKVVKNKKQASVAAGTTTRTDPRYRSIDSVSEGQQIAEASTKASAWRTRTEAVVPNERGMPIYISEAEHQDLCNLYTAQPSQRPDQSTSNADNHQLQNQCPASLYNKQPAGSGQSQLAQQCNLADHEGPAESQKTFEECENWLEDCDYDAFMDALLDIP
ncbi:hypothetical protein BCR37DRAFT_378017 [Protomyces lactucae-debilis]|uniref:Uncharacterized protein n=1 Tax=Protomyces lactucae-debilis TaxID=2754530 RepID=A0A1Y2FPA6_PROLT|nr:uncharacterized protein BCR37DRAFT_378017 [Protomyces lactucae-debilis]ORY85036.1 hypothetical protein BCR37DRAFT_378017 [Protomyces lactucae-debilis]